MKVTWLSFDRGKCKRDVYTQRGSKNTCALHQWVTFSSLLGPGILQQLIIRISKKNQASVVWLRWNVLELLNAPHVCLWVYTVVLLKLWAEDDGGAGWKWGQYQYNVFVLPNFSFSVKIWKGRQSREIMLNKVLIWTPAFMKKQLPLVFHPDPVNSSANYLNDYRCWHVKNISGLYEPKTELLACVI